MKMVDEEYSYVWLQPFDPLFSSCLSDAQMSTSVWEDWRVMDDVKYIGDGEFIATEEWLRGTLSQAVSMNVAYYPGVDNWQGRGRGP